jgi:hypothetical protein
MLVLLFVLYLAMVALNVLDGVSTWLVIKPDNYDWERNRIARGIFRKLGILRGIIIAEAVWILVVSGIFLLMLSYATMHFLLLLLLIFGVFVYSLIVTGNFRSYLRLRKREISRLAPDKAGRA